MEDLNQKHAHNYSHSSSIFLDWCEDSIITKKQYLNLSMKEEREG